MSRAIVLVDHGSRLGAANAVLEQMAALLRQAAPDRIVHVAHMELAPPSLSDAIDACAADGAQNVAVVPYFLAPGLHSTRDIPRLAEEAARRHPEIAVRVCSPLGAHAKLAEVVLERVDAEGK